jgi:hypothetical protein
MNDIVRSDLGEGGFELCCTTDVTSADLGKAQVGLRLNEVDTRHLVTMTGQVPGQVAADKAFDTGEEDFQILSRQ